MAGGTIGLVVSIALLVGLLLTGTPDIPFLISNPFCGCLCYSSPLLQPPTPLLRSLASQKNKHKKREGQRCTHNTSHTSAPLIAFRRFLCADIPFFFLFVCLFLTSCFSPRLPGVLLATNVVSVLYSDYSVAIHMLLLVFDYHVCRVW